LSWEHLTRKPKLNHFQYHVENGTNKGTIKLVLQKSPGKIHMPIPNSSIEITKRGSRRTTKTNSKNPTWKVRVG
jgi:hypothetical protein